MRLRCSSSSCTRARCARSSATSRPCAGARRAPRAEAVRGGGTRRVRLVRAGGTRRVRLVRGGAAGAPRSRAGRGFWTRCIAAWRDTAAEAERAPSCGPRPRPPRSRVVAWSARCGGGAPACSIRAPPRTNRTRLVPPARTNRTRLVPPTMSRCVAPSDIWSCSERHRQTPLSLPRDPAPRTDAHPPRAAAGGCCSARWSPTSRSCRARPSSPRCMTRLRSFSCTRTAVSRRAARSTTRAPSRSAPRTRARASSRRCAPTSSAPSRHRPARPARPARPRAPPPPPATARPGRRSSLAQSNRRSDGRRNE